MRKSFLVFLVAGIVIMGCTQPLPPAEAVIELSRVNSEKGNFQGLEYDANSESIFFGRKGNTINRMNLETGESSLVAEIEGASTYWSGCKGYIFVCDIEMGPDRLLYVAARKQVLTVNPENGVVKVLFDNVFNGPWGAYGLCCNQEGDLFIGDQFGGVQFCDKDNEWERTSILKPNDTTGVLATFSGVLLDKKEKTLYVIDQANSLLLICPLKWKEGVPMIKSVEKVELGIDFPEYMVIWNGDIFIQAVKEHKIVRIRNGEIIQTLKPVSSEGTILGTLASLSLIVKDENSADIFVTSWDADQGIYRGEIIF